jgi:hypothetical protein
MWGMGAPTETTNPQAGGPRGGNMSKLDGTAAAGVVRYIYITTATALGRSEFASNTLV